MLKRVEQWSPKDLWWLLALPVYVVVGTVRHESSHAIVAILQGARITAFQVLPSRQQDGFLFGFVQWAGGNVSWVATAAPYLCDLATITIAFVLCSRWLFRNRWVLINVAIVGLVSPLVNSAYNYIRVGSGARNDVAQLLTQLPRGVVHMYFLGTISLYVVTNLAFARRLLRAPDG